MGFASLYPSYELSHHDHRRSDRDAIVEVHDVLIGHPEAARGHRLADGLRLVRAVDAVERGAEIHSARAERVVETAGHVARQVGTPSQHLCGRGPARPLLLGGDTLHPAPGEAVAADTDAVADRLAVAGDEIEAPLRGIDHDRAGRVRAGIAHARARNRRDAVIAAERP